MKTKITEHILSLIFVTLIMLGSLYLINLSQKESEQEAFSEIKEYVHLDFVNFNIPFQKALFKDVLNIFHPGQYDSNNQLIRDILQYKEIEFSESMQGSHQKDTMSIKKLWQVIGMYTKFIIVYILVMLLTYYGVQTLGVWRFVRKKQKSTYQICITDTKNRTKKKKNIIITIGTNIIKGIASFILFCPAYVIAYSLKTELNTDTIIFMILLGVTSNGLLIMYTNKFYAFLIAESRKGYVQTAIVKNMYNSYEHHGSDGISYKSIFSLKKNFGNHVFEHIFRNAHLQYISTIKEQACFLISGLIIIEMALNIHGYLSYEMLRQILYKNFDIVIVIILFIFYTSKLTEVYTDFLLHRETMKYEN